MENKSKGITLVALVITIVILLILAGISIQAITNTGLFENAKRVAEESKYANAEEKVKLAVLASYDKNAVLNKELLKDSLNKIDGINPKVTEVKWDLTVNVDGYEFIITEYGTVTCVGRKDQETLPDNTPENPQDVGKEVALKEGWGTQTVKYIKTSDGTEVTELETVSTVYAISVGNGETVPVPYGFYYVGGTKDTGVVISDDARDKNKYAGEVEVPAGAIYDIATGIVKTESELTEEEKKTVIFGNQFVWIPCTLSEYTKYNFGKTDASGWDTSTNTAEKTQIQKYGGFYIGRYEAGASDITFANNYTLTAPTGGSGWQNTNFTSSKVIDGKIATKAGQIPYFHSNYTTAIEMSEAMYNTNSVNSGLITGTMWDVTLNYLKSQDSTLDVTNSAWGNYNSDTSRIEGSGITYTAGRGRYLSVNLSNGVESGSFKVSDTSYHQGIRTSGWSDGTRKNNIYDLAGNLWEWTQEYGNYSSQTSIFILRGGSFYSAYSSNGGPVCYRANGTANRDATYRGFRPVLYIK